MKIDYLKGNKGGKGIAIKFYGRSIPAMVDQVMIELQAVLDRRVLPWPVFNPP